MSPLLVGAVWQQRISSRYTNAPTWFGLPQRLIRSDRPKRSVCGKAGVETDEKRRHAKGDGERQTYRPQRPACQYIGPHRPAQPSPAVSGHALHAASAKTAKRAPSPIWRAASTMAKAASDRVGSFGAFRRTGRASSAAASASAKATSICAARRGSRAANSAPAQAIAAAVRPAQATATPSNCALRPSRCAHSATSP